ncbi:MAG: sensor histidine kinase [Nocardioides sp.]|uniref:sensor histidine kinase n=1 Tax=Nocardioides sp. TaxID=35761 RepID=UPI003F106903
MIGSRVGVIAEQRTLFAPGWYWAGVATVVAMCVIGLLGWFMPVGLVRRLCVAVPTASLLLQLTSFGAFIGPDPEVLPWVWSLEAAAITLLVVVLPARWAVAALLVSAVSVSASAWAFLGHVPHTVLAVTPVHVGNVAFVAIFVGVRHRLMSLSVAEEAAREAHERQVHAEARAQRQRELRGVVHDEVLSVLIAARYFRGSPPAALTGAAAHALDVLALATEGAEPAASGEATVDERSALDSLAAHAVRTAPHVELSVSAPIRGAEVPLRVVDGMGRAMAEALRNADRHARATTVRVNLRVDGPIDTPRFVVRVIDDGRGFAETHGDEARLGIRSSILERMRDLGGSADVLSSPGAGTEVTLTWPR